MPEIQAVYAKLTNLAWPNDVCSSSVIFEFKAFYKGLKNLV